MILQRQSLQILKIIAGHFKDQDKQQFLIVAKDKLCLLNNNLDELESININSIIDAITIKIPTAMDKVAVLTKSNQIQIYDNNLAHYLTFEIQDPSQPHKLIQIENTLFITNFIHNCTEIQDFLYPQRQFINHKTTMHIHNIFQHGHQILYTVLNNQEYSIYSLNQVLVKQISINQECCRVLENMSLGMCIIYSLNKLYIYEIFSEQPLFDIQITEQIVDIHPMFNSNNKYLVVTMNGTFYEIDYKNNTSINFKNIFELNSFKEIQSICFTLDSIFLVDESGIKILNNQFHIVKQQKLYTNMNKLQIINNKMYASKHLTNSTEFYRVDQVQEIRLNKQSDFMLNPDELINSIIQRNRKIIIFTNQRLIVKEKNQQISYKLNDPQDYIQINDELFLLAESNKLQLLKITSEIEQISFLNLSFPILQLRSNQQNTFYGYDSNGCINEFKLNEQKFEQQMQILTNLFDLTEFIVIDQLLIYGNFSNELNVYNLQTQTIIRKIVLNQPVKQLIQNNEQLILGCLFGDIIIYDLQSFSLLNKYQINEQEIDLNYLQVQNNRILVNCKQKQIYRNYLIQVNEISELIIPQLEQTNQQYPYFNQNNIQMFSENKLNVCELKQKTLEFNNENYQTIFEGHVKYASDNIIITKTAINIIERSSQLILKYSYDITSYPTFTSADYRQNQLLCAFENKLILFSVKWDKKIQVLQEVQLIKPCFAVRLSKDLMIVGQGNHIEIYQKSKDKKLFTFQVISITQIEIQRIFIEEFVTQNTDKSIVIDIATNKCMIAEFHLKYNHEQENIELMKITKEFHSPINLTSLSDAYINKNEWLVFSKLQKYDIYQKIQWAEGGYLKPLNQKNVIQDIVVDSIQYENKMYFLGICGALWSKNCDDEQYL